MEDPNPAQSVVRFGVFEFDREAGQLRKHGLKVKLHGQPLQALELLLERRGHVVTREQMCHKLWGATFLGDPEHGLNDAIKRLREALGDSADTPRFVETVPRRGYRFIAPVETEEQAVSEPRARLQLVWIGALAVVALLLVLVGLNVGGLRQRLLGGATPPPGKIMLAVLPFDNLSADPGQEYFSDGLTEEMIAQLGRLHPQRLGVIARTSAMHYKGTDKNVDEIGRELGVDYILEGGVRRAADRVRITAQLIQVSDQTQLWAESYERELADVFSIQSEVSKSVARSLALELLPAEQEHLASPRPVNPAAHEAYLKGRYFWNKRTGEGLKQSLEYFQQAIAADPNHPTAYAGLADSYNMLGEYGVLSPKDAFPQARAAALKALEIDDALAEAHASLANVLVDYDREWSAAEQEFQRAIKLNANYATAHQWYAEYLSFMGRHEEALVEIQLAREVDPVSLIINAVEGWILYQKREHGRAIEQCQKTLELDPGFIPAHNFLGLAYVQEGRYEAAHAEFRTTARLSDGNPRYQAHLSISLAASGRKDEAREIIDELLESSRRFYVNPVSLAIAYAHLGEKDHAIKWLKRGFADRSHLMVYLRGGPRLDPLRSDPRFQSLLRRMNFPE